MVSLIVAGHHLIMTPGVHGAIERVGQRVGRVLPQGYSTSSRQHLRQDLASVSIKLQPFTDLEFDHPMVINDSSASKPVRAGIDPRVPIMMIVLYFSVLSIAGVVVSWRRRRIDFHRLRPGAFVGALSLGAGVCVLFSMIFVGSKVLWMGADHALTDRAIVHIAGSSTVHIRSDQLLAMGSRELGMILGAVVMSVLPILYLIDTKLFGLGSLKSDPSLRARPISSSSNEALTHQFPKGWTRFLGGVCYAGVVLFLWAAPWSMTMVGLFWR